MTPPSTHSVTGPAPRGRLTAGEAAIHPLEIGLAEAWSPAAWQDVSVLLAVSGGADSMAMLRGMARLKTDGAGRLLVGHLHHGLRGQEADDDARLVCAGPRCLTLSPVEASSGVLAREPRVS